MSQEELDKMRGQLAKNCKDARVARQITITELSDMTGLGASTIRRFEEGNFWLNMKQYLLIRDALGMGDIK